MSTPSSASASVTWEQANSSSRGSSRRSPSISVTWLPSVWNACDISTPTTPPPITTSRSGISLGRRRLAVRPRAVDRVQPLDRRHRRRRAAGQDHRPPGLDRPRRRRSRGARPSSFPQPRSSVTPRSSSHGSCTESSRSWITSSRRSSTAGTSSSPVTASAAPGMRLHLGQRLVRPQQRLRRHARPVRALAADEPVLHDGHRQARARPSRPAATSPAGPAPITTTSKLRIGRDYNWRATIAPGDDRLRRGRFVGAVASRGTGGLVKPR